MKKELILILGFILLVWCSLAQDKTARESIFSRTEVESWGIRMGPEFHIGSISDKSVLFYGHTLEFNINREYAVGVGYYPLSRAVSFDFNDAGDVDSSYSVDVKGYGIYLKYFVPSQKSVRAAFVLDWGGGRINATKQVRSYNPVSDSTYIRTELIPNSYISVKPGVQIDICLTKTLHLNFGVSYLWAYGHGLEFMKNDGMSSIYVVGGIKLGMI